MPQQAANFWDADPVAGGSQPPNPAMSTTPMSPASPAPQPAANQNWWANDPPAPAKPQIPASAPSGAPEAPPAEEDGSAVDKYFTHPAHVVASGALKGVAETPFLPLDMVGLGMKGGNYLMNKATGGTDTGASEAANHIMGLGAAGVSKLYEEAGAPLATPQNTPEKYLDTAAQFATGGTAMGAKMLPSIGAGLSSEAAGQATEGTDWENLARLVGGGMGYAGAERAGNAFSKEPIPDAAAPGQTFNASPRQMSKATQAVEGSATNPQDLNNTLENLPNGGELVPGVKPTLGEVANDQGIAQAQNAMRTKMPEPFQAKADTRQNKIAQNLDTATKQGNPEDVGRSISQQLQSLDQQMDTGDQALSQYAQSKIAPLGSYGEQPENPVGDKILDARAVRHDKESDIWKPVNGILHEPGDLLPARNAAQTVENSTQEYGASDLHPNVKTVTNALLNPPQGAQDTIGAIKRFRTMVSEQQRQLPPGSNTAMSQLQNIKNGLDTGLDNTIKGRALQPQEHYDKNPQGPSDVPSGKMTASLSASTPDAELPDYLQKRFTKGDEFAGEQLNNMAMQKLHENLSHIPGVNVEGDYATGLYGGSHEPSLRAEIEYDPKTEAQVLQGLGKTGEDLKQHAIYMREDTSDPEGMTYPDGSYSTPSYKINLTKPLNRQEVQQIIDKSGLYGLTSHPNYLEAYHVGDPNDAGSRAEFHQAINRVAENLGERVGGIEQQTSRLWSYGDENQATPYGKASSNARSTTQARPSEINSAPESKAPTAFGKKELNDYETARQTTFRNRVMDDLEKSGAVNPNGEIDVKKYDGWYNRIINKKRLNNDDEFTSNLRDARNAQEALDQFRADRVQTQKDFEASRLSEFLDKNADPVGVVGRIFKSQSVDSAKEFRGLVDKVKADPDALSGLKTTVSQYINDKIAKASIDEKNIGKVSRPDALRNFITQNKGALREIYGGGQELNNLEAVAAEIRRNQRYEEMANIKGQSNTAKNLAQNAKNTPKSTMLGWVVKNLAAAGGSLVGLHLGGLHGAAEGFGVGKIAEKIVHAMRGSDLNTIEKVQLAMYNDPEFARVMLQRFGSENPSGPLLHRTAAAALRLVPASSATTSSGADKRRTAPPKEK